MYKRRRKLAYLDPDGKWHTLCEDNGDRQALYDALAKLHAAPQRSALDQLFDRFDRDVIPRKAERTQVEYRSQLRILRELLAEFTHPAHITPPVVAEIIDTYPRPIMANRLVALLSAIMTKAVRWGLVPMNPCRGIERNKEKPAGLLVTDEQFQRVLKRAPQPIRDAMMLAYRTGQRQGDLLRLRWSQVDLDAGTIDWRQAKTGTELLQTLGPGALDLLRELRSRTVVGMTVLLSPKGKPWSSSGFQSAWQRLRAGFPFRAIRPKSATDHETGKHLGHVDERTLRRFYRLGAIEVDTNERPIEGTTGERGE